MPPWEAPARRRALDGPPPRPAAFWSRIATVLRAELAEGAHPPGRPLPGEHRLAERFGAARMTVRRAMDSLEAEGLIRREAGRGAFPLPAPGGNAAGWAADVRGFSASSEVSLLFLGTVPAPPRVAAALRLAPGAAVVALERARRDAAGPFSHGRSWVPLPLGAALPRARLEAGETLPDLLAERGARLGRAEQFLGAEAASPDVAEALGLALGAPLVRLERTMLDAGGAPFAHTRFLYRADRFAYGVPLDAAGRADPPRWHPLPPGGWP